jgi:lipopolysaccharide biosynthesis regulator YciM
MSPYLIPAIGVIVVVLFVFIVWVVVRQRGKAKPNLAQKHYIDGLNLLIDGHLDPALEKLRKTVQMDTGFINAYIKIADIYRRKGEPDKAIKICRDLLIRPNLTEEQRHDILKSLAEDYIADQKWQQALVVINQLLNLNSHDHQTRQQKVIVLEQMGDWQGAFDIVRKESDLDKEEKKYRLAAYKYEQGLQLVKEQKEHDARVRFRDAIKEVSTFVPAYLEIADSYIRQDRSQDALSILKKYIKVNPNLSNLAFSRLKQVLFEMGKFGDIEQVYAELARENPQVVEGHLGLAEIYEKKGELLKAVDACKRALQADPGRVEAKLFLVRLYGKLGRDEAASDLAGELATQIISRQKHFECKMCGHLTDNYFYRCPHCRAWNSAIKR